MSTTTTAAAPRRTVILLIDDDERFLDVTERRLAHRDYDIRRAQSWVDAIPHLRDEPDLVLLDVRMVSLSGDRLCSLIKERNPTTLVVLYSSEPESTLQAMATARGADGYLSKSVDRAELVDRIERLLTTKGRKAKATSGLV